MSQQPNQSIQKDSSKHLLLQVRFLLERYHGKEWPPSPRRLFLAFVAALYQSSKQQISTSEGEEALQFFEKQKPPIIHAAPENKGCTYTIYVPNNDHDLISKAYVKGKISNRDPKKLTTKKEMIPYITDTIQYLWEIESNEENKKHIEVLCKLAKEIPVFGLGIDPVAVYGKVVDHVPLIDKADHYISDEHNGEIGIDTPIQGLLDDAKKHHKEFLERIQNNNFIKPSTITKYHNQKYRKDRPVREIIMFSIKNITDKTTIIANNIVPEVIKKLDEIKSNQIGDEQKGNIKTIVLPSIGNKFADAMIRRVAFIIQPNTDIKFKQSLHRQLNSEIIEINNNKYQLEINAKDKMQKTYDKSSRSWCSVTPLDLDIQNNSTREDITRSILNALKNESIDESVKFVNFRKESYWNNIPKTSGTLVYAELEFESEVKGPFVIGKNQNFGHGLFAPNKMPDVAYFAVLGKRPSIEKTISVADLMRRAVMSKIKNIYGDKSIPSYISGHDITGKPMRENHKQAFWLPVDLDHDGFIDHIAVFVRGGYDSLTRKGFYGITKLDDGHDQRLDVFFKGFYTRENISKKCKLFDKQKDWNTITPYFMPWHIKKKFGRDEQIKKELKKHRQDNNIPNIDEHNIQIHNRHIPITKFQNIHNNKKPIKPIGDAIKLSFRDPVRGPISLGFGSHFGLGMFEPSESNTK